MAADGQAVASESMNKIGNKILVYRWGGKSGTIHSGFFFETEHPPEGSIAKIRRVLKARELTNVLGLWHTQARSWSVRDESTPDEKTRWITIVPAGRGWPRVLLPNVRGKTWEQGKLEDISIREILSAPGITKCRLQEYVVFTTRRENRRFFAPADLPVTAVLNKGFPER